MASSNGCSEIVNTLISKGAKVDACDSQRRTPLHYAAMSGHWNICDILIKQVRSIIPLQKLFWLLVLVTRMNLAHILYELNDLMNDFQGANLHVGDRKQRTAFLFAVEKGQIETVNFLLSQHCDIGRFDDLNQNSLHIAVQENRLEMLQLLLQV